VSDLFRSLTGTVASPSVLLDIEDNDDTNNRPCSSRETEDVEDTNNRHTVQETLKILRILITCIQFKTH